MKFSRLIERVFYFLKKSNFTIFLIFALIVFIAYHKLFNSYFEADEWFHFSHYLPLTKNSWGSLIALLRSITDAQALSEGQHVVPIGEELFFLNTLFFGFNFKFYAFASILLHSINSFLVFIFIKELLIVSKNELKKTLFAFCGGIFFALSAIPMHTVTWSAFYGQNTLSVTFFIFTILFLNKGLNSGEKKYLFGSSLFLLLDLLTKETATVLIFIIPIMILLGNKNFKIKSLLRIYFIPLVFFITFRFVLPCLYIWINSWIDQSFKLNSQNFNSTAVNSGVNFWLIFYRIVTFPLSMLSRIYFPGDTILSFMKVIAPFIYYQYPGEGDVRSQYRLFFIYGPGNNLFFYLIALVIIVFTFILMRDYFKNKNYIEAKTALLGFLIIVIGALPLVLNVLNLPWWGTDYFDSRHYYMPSVGAAILLPFLLLFISEKISFFLKKILRITFPTLVIAFLLFALWFFNNMVVFKANLYTIVDLTGYPRKQIIAQMKKYLPVLQPKTVIYAETDGGGAYGSILPFQTSFPQILTLVYYDKNPLPDSFFNSFFLDAKPQGYLYSEGRGLGFYNSKKSLVEALTNQQFFPSDIYAFYYDSHNIKIKDITESIRQDMTSYLKNAQRTRDWKSFNDPLFKLSFSYPSEIQVSDISNASEAGVLRSLRLNSQDFNANLRIMNISSTFDLNEFARIYIQGNESSRIFSKRVFFDEFNFNNTLVIMGNNKNEYFIKLDDKLVYLTIPYVDRAVQNLAEMMLGSVNILK